MEAEKSMLIKKNWVKNKELKSAGGKRKVGGCTGATEGSERHERSGRGREGGGGGKAVKDMGKDAEIDGEMMNEQINRCANRVEVCVLRRLAFGLLCCSHVRVYQPLPPCVQDTQRSKIHTGLTSTVAQTRPEYQPTLRGSNATPQLGIAESKGNGCMHVGTSMGQKVQQLGPQGTWEASD